MRAVPRGADRILRRLEEVRHRRPGAREAERAIREARGLVERDAGDLIRLHDALCFLRAYPHSRRVRDLAESFLGTIARRVRALESAGEDLSPFDAPEVAGIAGTTIGTDFSFELVRWLARRFPRRVRLAWDAGASEERMRAAWPEFVPLLEEEALADANVPYLDWLAAAAGRRRDDPAWLLDRYGRLLGPPALAADRFDALGVPIAWDLGDGPASRTRMRVPGPAPFFQDAPFLSRRDVSLDAVMSGPPLALRKLSRREGERFCERVREATTARYREFYTFTHADPTSVVAARPGRGVELFLVGVLPERRLPLRSAYGGFVVKNGMPIGYIEGLAFFERLEIGFNMYYTFREGESAWIYAQVLKLHRDALGVTSFSIDPYQLGYENEEALASGAFWFYRKLGFRPTGREARALVAREEDRIAQDPGHRSSRATLGRLVERNLIYDAPGTRGRRVGPLPRPPHRPRGQPADAGAGPRRRGAAGTSADARRTLARTLDPEALAAGPALLRGPCAGARPRSGPFALDGGGKDGGGRDRVGQGRAPREPLPAPPAEAREASRGAASSGLGRGGLGPPCSASRRSRRGSRRRSPRASGRRAAGRSGRGGGRGRSGGSPASSQPRPPLLLGALGAERADVEGAAGKGRRGAPGRRASGRA